MTEPVKTAGELFISLDKCNLTKAFQISIGDDCSGYRLMGPKYLSSSPVNKVEISRRDANEIYRHLIRNFPELSQ